MTRTIRTAKMAKIRSLNRKSKAVFTLRLGLNLKDYTLNRVNGEFVHEKRYIWLVR